MTVLAPEAPDLRRLAEPPATLATTRAALHLLAIHVVAPAHTAATGTEIDLRWTPGGFGTPPLPGDRQVRVEGADLVVAGGGESRRQPIRSCRDAAQFVGGLSAGRIQEPLDVDADAARWLGAFFGFAYGVLSDLQATAPGATRPILWPEHFDYAIEAGDEAAGTRATYGLSPGDEHHPEPYAYVGPWQRRTGALWQATGFAGAELSLRAILPTGDHRATVAGFFAERLSALESTPAAV